VHTLGVNRCPGGACHVVDGPTASGTNRSGPRGGDLPRARWNRRFFTRVRPDAPGRCRHKDGALRVDAREVIESPALIPSYTMSGDLTTPGCLRCNRKTGRSRRHCLFSCRIQALPVHSVELAERALPDPSKLEVAGSSPVPLSHELLANALFFVVSATSRRGPTGAAAHNFAPQRPPDYLGAGTVAKAGVGVVGCHAVPATHRPLAAVRPATIAIAAPLPRASATSPASSAPSTKPKSRQKR
jgi:hypothetical protein